MYAIIILIFILIAVIATFLASRIFLPMFNYKSVQSRKILVIAHITSLLIISFLMSRIDILDGAPGGANPDPWSRFPTFLALCAIPQSLWLFVDLAMPTLRRRKIMGFISNKPWAKGLTAIVTLIIVLSLTLVLIALFIGILRF